MVYFINFCQFRPKNIKMKVENICYIFVIILKMKKNRAITILTKNLTKKNLTLLI